jgi:hypothetical protein
VLQSNSQHFRDVLDCLGESTRQGCNMKPALALPTRRMLTKIEAANYVGFKSTAGFAAWCPVVPVKIGTKILYDVRAIDRWLDSLGGLQAPEPKRSFADRAGRGPTS